MGNHEKLSRGNGAARELRLDSLIRRILGMPLSPTTRSVAVGSVYALALTVSYFLAWPIRFEELWSGQPRILLYAFYVIPVKLALLLAFGQFSGLMSYFSVPDVKRLVSSLLLGSAVPLTLWYLTDGRAAPPRGVIVIDFGLSLFLIATIRYLCRTARERHLSRRLWETPGRVWRVAIVGAGDAGSMLARELAAKSRQGMRPVMFFDDDRQKWKTRVHDIPVLGPPEMIQDPLISARIDRVVIAMPTAAAKRVGEIVRILQTAHLAFETVPGLDQLASGRVKVSQLRPVDIQDLLGRAPVELRTDEIQGMIAGRVVMVTGAGGSIGSELCRQIAAFRPARLLLVEQSEGHLFLIEQELVDKGFERIVVPVMADILDMPRMHDIFERYQPQIVFHAAAHKHVPMMERQPSEAIKNNTLGTVCLSTLALEFKVERFVLISTDKAINPTSVMGATKRLAEIFLQALWAGQPDQTKFMAVRFGNVLGSSGSVIPIFKKQIAAGGPVKVTHPDVVRYFMTIPEAVGLVLQCGAQGSGGEIFVLDMGDPVKIVDLARQLIELSGLRPGEDIEIEFTGLRPGEKLFEELSYKSENILPTRHPKIMRFVGQPHDLNALQKELQGLFIRLQEIDAGELKLQLKRLVPEYTPDLRPAELPIASAPPPSPVPRPRPWGLPADPDTGG